MNKILSVVASADLMRESHEQIDQIRTASGMTEQQFRALCIPMLRAYANRVQSLPFSSAVFSRPQGAWECGLICATVAYRVASTVIFFPDMGAEERRNLEPQCRFMCFIACLAYCVSSITNSARIYDGDFEYHPLLSNGTLTEWLSNHPNAQFAWRANAAHLTSQASAAVAARLIPPALLERFDLRAVVMIYSEIQSGSKLIGIESPVARVVRQSVQGVLEHYTKSEATTYQGSELAHQAPAASAVSIADQMVAAANRTIPINPLAPPGAVDAPADQGDETYDRHPAALSPAAQVQPTVTRPSTAAHTDQKDPLVGKDPVVVEWFKVLALHARYPDLKKNLVVSQEGIHVPINMLGMFGVSGPTIRKKMEEAGLVVKRSDDGCLLILIPQLHQHFFADAAQAAD
jgi:hypothetical protein